MNIDEERGIEALKIFHNKSIGFPAYGGISFEDFLNLWGGKNYMIYVEGVGMSIRLGELSQSSVNEVMSNMASAGQGRLPADKQAFQKALGKNAGTINWFSVATEAFSDVTTQVGSGVTSFGDNALTIVSTLNKFMVPIVLAFVGAWLWARFNEVKK